MHCWKPNCHEGGQSCNNILEAFFFEVNKLCSVPLIVTRLFCCTQWLTQMFQKKKGKKQQQHGIIWLKTYLRGPVSQSLLSVTNNRYLSEKSASSQLECEISLAYISNCDLWVSQVLWNRAMANAQFPEHQITSLELFWGCVSLALNNFKVLITKCKSFF